MGRDHGRRTFIGCYIDRWLVGQCFSGGDANPGNDAQLCSKVNCCGVYPDCTRPLDGERHYPICDIALHDYPKPGWTWRLIENFENWLLAVLLLSLRVVPVFTFAPPFTLLRIPGIVRLLLGLSLTAWLVSGNPEQTYLSDFTQNGLFGAAIAELMIGVVITLAFQIVFAALYTAGRTIDIQAGFGLALLIEPATRSRTPLVGTLFAYAAGVTFFAMEGPTELLAIWSTSVEQTALGAGQLTDSLAALYSHLSISFLIAFGLAAVVLLALFLTDMTVAMMSKTLPQMHVLLLGFQAKAIMLLLILPISFSVGGTLFLRLIRGALDAATRMQ